MISIFRVTLFLAIIALTLFKSGPIRESPSPRHHLPSSSKSTDDDTQLISYFLDVYSTENPLPLPPVDYLESVQLDVEDVEDRFEHYENLAKLADAVVEEEAEIIGKNNADNIPTALEELTWKVEEKEKEAREQYTTMKRQEVTKLIDGDVEEIVTKMIFVEEVEDFDKSNGDDEMNLVEEILTEQSKLNEWDGSEISSLPSLDVVENLGERPDEDSLTWVEEIVTKDDGTNEWDESEHSSLPSLFQEEDVEGSGHFPEADVLFIVEELPEQES